MIIRFTIFLVLSLLAFPGLSAAQGAKPEIQAVLADVYPRKNYLAVAVSVLNPVTAIRVIYCPDGRDLWSISCRGREIIKRPKYSCNGYCLWSTSFSVGRKVTTASGYVVVKNRSGTVKRFWRTR